MNEDEINVETEPTEPTEPAEPTDPTDLTDLTEIPEEETIYMTDVLNYFTHDTPPELDDGFLTSIGSYVRSFVGVPPAGYEFLEYIVIACFFLLLFKFITNMFTGLGKFMGGR